ncbi:MAG: inositol monophosphatase, partial [Candidatus Micrarchaeota archaeon]|nr:inositol monophosphatase [Candidatus Micrarchaeota archaeon]
MASQLIAEKRFAIKLAEEAGKIIRENFFSGIKHGMKTRQKADKTLVTKTDTDINDMVIKAVRKEFPNHGVLGEEKSDIRKRGRYTWVVDPLDGTTVFTLGIPVSVFSLALTRDGIPVTGVVYDPFLQRLFSAEIYGGAFLNGNPINVSTNNKLEHSTVGLGYWRKAEFDLKPLQHKLQNAGVNVLQLGSLAYMGALVANGSFIALIHPASMTYDSAAL